MNSKKNGGADMGQFNLEKKIREAVTKQVKHKSDIDKLYEKKIEIKSGIPAASYGVLSL